jgi:hypothetical protein
MPGAGSRFCKTFEPNPGLRKPMSMRPNRLHETGPAKELNQI